MIRIQRPPEPIELRTARRKCLAHAMLLVQAGKPFKFDDHAWAAAYAVARAPLYHAQNQKCAYCERQQGLSSQPVEHFRPKGGVEGGDPLCYFWLAWTWENLLFACNTCNQRPNKGNRFPLAPRTTALPPPTTSEILSGQGPAFEIHTEQPLLVDPAREDPLIHILWRPENPDDSPDEQRWRPMHRSPRGESTIDIMGLRSDLPDHIGSHIRTYVNPGVRRIRCAMAADKRDLVESEWNQLVHSLFVPLQPYHAASHDALNYWIPDLDRKAWGLALPRPGRFEATPAPDDIPDHPKLAQMPDTVRLEVRAGRKSADELILLLCQETAWSETELADATGLAFSTIQGGRRTLVRSNRLTSGATGFRAASADNPGTSALPNINYPVE